MALYYIAYIYVMIFIADNGGFVMKLQVLCVDLKTYIIS